MNPHEITSPISKLSLELVGHIVDYLHDEPSTLRMCSLVCSYWVIACRFHLFFELVIAEDTYEAFCTLLASPLCSIPRIIYHLRLRSGFFGIHPDFLWLKACLPVLGGYLDRVLHEVTFDCVKQHMVDVRALLKRWNPRCITILGSLLGPMAVGEVVRLLAGNGSGLREVRLDFPSCYAGVDQDESAEFEVVTMGPCDLSKLSVNWASLCAFGPWLVAQGCLDNVTHLSFSHLPVSGGMEVQRLLDRVGPMLEFLDLGFEGSEISNPDLYGAMSVDFSGNTSLRIVSFPLYPTTKVPTVSDTFCSSLFTLCSPSLHTVVLNIQAAKWEDVRCIDWATVDAFLASYTGLKEVVFSFCQPLEKRLSMEKKVKKAEIKDALFPECSQRRMMSISIETAFADPRIVFR